MWTCPAAGSHAVPQPRVQGYAGAALDAAPADMRRGN